MAGIHQMEQMKLTKLMFCLFSSSIGDICSGGFVQTSAVSIMASTKVQCILHGVHQGLPVSIYMQTFWNGPVWSHLIG